METARDILRCLQSHFSEKTAAPVQLRSLIRHAKDMYSGPLSSSGTLPSTSELIGMNSNPLMGLLSRAGRPTQRETESPEDLSDSLISSLRHRTP